MNNKKKKDPRSSFDWAFVDTHIVIEERDWDAEDLARRILAKIDGDNQLTFWGSDDLEERRWK